MVIDIVDMAIPKASLTIKKKGLPPKGQTLNTSALRVPVAVFNVYRSPAVLSPYLQILKGVETLLSADTVVYGMATLAAVRLHVVPLLHVAFAHRFCAGLAELVYYELAGLVTSVDATGAFRVATLDVYHHKKE